MSYTPDPTVHAMIKWLKEIDPYQVLDALADWQELRDTFMDNLELEEVGISSWPVYNVIEEFSMSTEEVLESWEPPLNEVVEWVAYRDEGVSIIGKTLDELMCRHLKEAKEDRIRVNNMVKDQNGLLTKLDKALGREVVLKDRLSQKEQSIETFIEEVQAQQETIEKLRQEAGSRYDENNLLHHQIENLVADNMELQEKLDDVRAKLVQSL